MIFVSFCSDYKCKHFCSPTLFNSILVLEIFRNIIFHPKFLSNSQKRWIFFLNGEYFFFNSVKTESFVVHFSSLWTLNERYRIRTLGESDLQRWSYCWNRTKTAMNIEELCLGRDKMTYHSSLKNSYRSWLKTNFVDPSTFSEKERCARLF